MWKVPIFMSARSVRELHTSNSIVSSHSSASDMLMLKKNTSLKYGWFVSFLNLRLFHFADDLHSTDRMKITPNPVDELGRSWCESERDEGEIFAAERKKCLTWKSWGLVERGFIKRLKAWSLPLTSLCQEVSLWICPSSMPLFSPKHLAGLTNEEKHIRTNRSSDWPEVFHCHRGECSPKWWTVSSRRLSELGEREERVTLTASRETPWGLVKEITRRLIDPARITSINGRELWPINLRERETKRSGWEDFRWNLLIRSDSFVIFQLNF